MPSDKKIDEIYGLLKKDRDLGHYSLSREDEFEARAFLSNKKFDVNEFEDQMQ